MRYGRSIIIFFLLIATQAFSLSPPSKPTGWDDWTFGQKIAWRGLNLDPRIPYGPLVDKLQVKQIVRDEMQVAKVFFATDDPSHIFIKKLPTTFVMKVNNSSGKSLLIKNGMLMKMKNQRVESSSKKCMISFLRSCAENWLVDVHVANKEKQYGLVKPMIFFEEYLENITMEVELYFFNGKVRLISLFSNDEFTGDVTASYYDEDWKIFDVTHPMNSCFCDYRVNTKPIEKPPYIDRLIAFGERFAEKIDHVRIDFFVRGQDIYFGEFTFTTEGGNNLDHLNTMMESYWDFPDPNNPLVNPYLDDLLLRIVEDS